MLLLALAGLTGCSHPPSEDADSAAPVIGTTYDTVDCVIGPAWTNTDLTWRTQDNLLESLGDNGVYAARAAFEMWADDGTGLHFEESSIADIALGVFQGEHGDGEAFAFDGPGGVAGHAFDNGDPVVPGEVHLDTEELWSDGPSYDAAVLDVQTVIAHEIGHALGLCHIDADGALMSATYQGRIEALTEADIAALRELYPSDDDGDTGEIVDDTEDTGDTGEDTTPDCVDEDGDGYGNGTACEGADCDDTDATVYEAEFESSWSDNRDNDCDGIEDELDVGEGSDYDIDDALQWASSTDVQVIIAPGTYTPTSARSFSTRTSSITGTSADEVIIDLSTAGCLYQMSSGSLTLSGLTIQNGEACDSKGGVIYQMGGDLTLENCAIASNSAQWGGAIFQDDGTLSITTCTFTGNQASSEGGAIYHSGGSVEMWGVVFAENSASSSGGAVYVDDDGSFSGSNLIFANNTAGSWGGGMLISDGGSLEFATFVGNEASTGGGIKSSGDGAVVSHALFYDHGSSYDVHINSDYCMSWSMYEALYGGSWDDCGENLWGDEPLFYSYSDDGTYNDDLRLVGGSPGKDDGDSSCTDADGSQCDRGAYGGAYSSLLP